MTFDDLEVFLGTVDGTSTGADPAGSPPGHTAFAAEGGDGDGGEGGARSTGGDAGGEAEPDRATAPFAAGGSGGGTGGPPPATDEDIRALAAPAADLTTPTTLYKMTRFLFDDGGAGTAEQAGADLSVLVPSRISLVHGFVRDAWGEPLDGVDVWAVGHPEFGTTTTRTDGSYDFVVTGGLPLALALTKDDYLTAHRHVATKTGDAHRLDDALLLQPDVESSPIDFVDPIEVHHAFTVNDGAADRMATLMFRQGTQATMVFADQTTQALPQMTVRLTEFTVGPDGQQRMPARLPPGTAYNYALEISADEAEAAGAVSVELDTPAVLYVDNFLGWDVGVVAPSGAYDRSAGRWVGEPDGRVIEIVGIDAGGLAEIDLEWDDPPNSTAATAQELADLGITDDERAELAAIYDVGAQLWRVDLHHFTPYDINPSAGDSVGEPPEDDIRPQMNDDAPKPKLGCGSIIEIDNQGLGETMPVAGTPFTLHYRSARTRGGPNRGLSVDVTGADPPANLVGGLLLVSVAGRTLTAVTGPDPNSVAEIQWDGLDAFGRPVQGPQPIDLCVGWAFPFEGGDSQPAPAGSTDSSGGPGPGANGPTFGQPPIGAFRVHVPGTPFTTRETLLKCYGNGKSVAAAQAGEITQASKYRLGGLDAQTISDGLGGWTLDVHHTLARSTATLYKGDGSEREVSDEAMWVATRFAGNQVGTGSVSLEGPATGAQYALPSAIDVDRHGNIYVATPGLVRKIGIDGEGSIVAGTPNGSGLVPASLPSTTGFSGDGGPATAALLQNNIPGLAVDAEGGIYIADAGNFRVRYVDPSGTIDTVAGSGSPSGAEADLYNGQSQTGGDPLLASLSGVRDLAITADGGGLLIAQLGLLRKLRNGVLGHIAGLPRPSWVDLNEEVPSEDCDGVECPVGGLKKLMSPFNTVRGFEQSRAEWGHVPGTIEAVAAYGGRSYFGQTSNQIDPSLRFIQGPDIYGFRTEHDTSSLQICGAAGCNFPTTTDVVQTVRSIHADRDGVFYATDFGLVRAFNDLDQPQEVILPGPSGTTPIGNGVDVVLARDLQTSASLEVARGPDGSLYVADWGDNVVYRVARAVPPMYVSSWLTSEDGSELFSFDGEGRHLETRDALTFALVWSFTYDSDGLLSSIVDRHGNTTLINRDATGRATSIVGPDAHSTTLGYDANGYLDTITDPSAATTSFSYSATGLMSDRTDADASAPTSTFLYDSRGRLTNDDTHVSYPGEANETLAQTLEITTHDGDTREIEHTSAELVETRYTLQRTAPSSLDQVATYADGTQATDGASPEGDNTTSASGTTYAADYGLDFRLGANTRVPTQTDVAVPGGDQLVETYDRSYDPHCTVFSEDCTPGDPGVDPEFQADQIIASRTRAGTETWTQTYQRAHVAGGSSVPATITTTTPAGRQTTMTLDDDDQLASVQVGNLAPVDFAYDGRGRLLTVTRTDGIDTRTATITYNVEGFVDTVTDALSQTTTYGYDGVGRVVSRTYPDSRVVAYTYDEDGDRETVTPPGKPVHTFTYDSADRRREYDPPQPDPPLTSPETPETLYVYTGDHRPDLITRPDGETLDYAYDATTGKLVTVTTPDGNYAYTYYENVGESGQLETITDPTGEVLTYTYDGFLLASEAYSGDFTASIAWTHDAQLRVESEAVNGEDPPIAMTYDAEGVLSGAGALTLTRDVDHGLLDTTTVGSLTSSHDHNAFGERTQSVYDYNSTTVYQLDLTHDDLGRIKTKTQTLGGTTTLQCYDYDLSGRLISVSDGADSSGCTGTQVEAYTYDDNSNRTSATNSAGTLLPTDIDVDDQDRLLDYGSSSFTYTANGELATKQDGTDTWTFTYDASGNLEQVILPAPASTDIDYIHDGRNRRVGKRVDGTLVQGFIYRDQLNPVAEVDGTGALVSRFVYGTKPNVPDYMVRDGNTYRIISDHLGSVVAVVDVATGTIAQQIEYDAWGRILSDANPGFQPFGFAGGLYDPDTGLVRFGARDYDPRDRTVAREGPGPVRRGWREPAAVCPR